MDAPQNSRGACRGHRATRHVTSCASSFSMKTINQGYVTCGYSASYINSLGGGHLELIEIKKKNFRLSTRLCELLAIDNLNSVYNDNGLKLNY